MKRLPWLLLLSALPALACKMEPAAFQVRAEEVVAKQAAEDSRWSWCSVRSVERSADGVFFSARRGGFFCADKNYYVDATPDCVFRTHPKK
ncbi:hypothetical protein K2X33_15335 [bacterium]|nr:hypothetical protein [bacterium]